MGLGSAAAIVARATAPDPPRSFIEQYVVIEPADVDIKASMQGGNQAWVAVVMEKPR